MLKLENVKKLYSNNRGLRNTTIEFQEGEITGILGRNGSGKTTLLKGILNLLPLDDGIITWNDKSVEEQFDKVAFITEDGSYFPYISSKEYGDFLSLYYPAFSKERYFELLDQFEVSKTDTIRTLAMNAKLIILDEPFTTLDIYAKEDTVRQLIEQVKEDVIILISTHNIEEIEAVIDRCVVLDDGMIKEDITMDELNESGKDLRALLDPYRPAVKK